MSMQGASAKQRRNRELALIHIGATKLGLIDRLDDTAYRNMLRTIARVDSAAKLDMQGREAVLKHLRACGFEPTARGRSSGPVRRRARSKDSPPGRYQAGSQAALIRHLWTSLHQAGAVRDASDRALRAFVERRSATYHPDRVGYSSPELLPEPVAQKLIEHLKRWCGRLQVDYQ